MCLCLRLEHLVSPSVKLILDKQRLPPLQLEEYREGREEVSLQCLQCHHAQGLCRCTQYCPYRKGLHPRRDEAHRSDATCHRRRPEPQSVVGGLTSSPTYRSKGGQSPCKKLYMRPGNGCAYYTVSHTDTVGCSLLLKALSQLRLVH